MVIRHIQGNRSAPEVERRLRKDTLPIIGHIPLPELHRRDVTRIIDAKSEAPKLPISSQPPYSGGLALGAPGCMPEPGAFPLAKSNESPPAMEEPGG